MDKQKQSYTSFVFALISFACPLFAFGICWFYLDYLYPPFTAEPGVPIDDADKHAAAMMGGVVVAYLVISIAIGSFVGLCFGFLSLWKGRRFVSFGTAATLFNLLPLLGIAYLIVFVREL